jgi:fructokinase
MIAVIGEALIDLVVGEDGNVAAHPGGGPFTTARALARLGVPSVFAGGLSGDGFGRLLRSRLAADGVRLGLPSDSGLPTTLAVADLDADGAARYHFYLDGTAAADVTYDALRAVVAGPSGPDSDAAGPESDAAEEPAAGQPAAVHVGTLGLVAEPVASSVERLVTEGLPAGTLVMVDPNCRPGAITDRDAYLGRLARIVARADIVKASADDMAYLMPDAPVSRAAGTLLDQGAGLVIVTDGARPASAFLPSGREIRVEAPVIDVVDTIGAGDTFGAAFLARWLGHGMTHVGIPRIDPSGTDAIDNDEEIRDALAFAVAAAAVTCTRAGAEPPYLAELTGRP